MGGLAASVELPGAEGDFRPTQAARPIAAPAELSRGGADSRRKFLCRMVTLSVAKNRALACMQYRLSLRCRPAGGEVTDCGGTRSRSIWRDGTAGTCRIRKR